MTFTDEAGHSAVHTSDALGRLVSVLEPGPSGNPSLPTTYSYDGFNNLIGVVQSGVSGETSRSRSFSYDGLSRLLTASNPESGTTCYGYGNGTTTGCAANGYDANGNLVAKTDARGIAQTFSYDSLNRPTSMTVGDGTVYKQI